MSTIVTSRWKCAKCGIQIYSSSYERMKGKTTLDYCRDDDFHFWEPIAS